MLYESLTTREKQIFTLLGEDLREKQICLELNFSLNCMKQHRKHIYNKMELDSKKEVICWFKKYKSLDSDRIV